MNFTNLMRFYTSKRRTMSKILLNPPNFKNPTSTNAIYPLRFLNPAYFSER